MIPDDPNAIEGQADNTMIPSEPLADAARLARDAAAATQQDAVNGGASPEGAPSPLEELAGPSDQLAERGIDLGDLVGTMLAGASMA
jgi:hypothetical protein